MDDITCTTKEVAPNHKLIFFHNDTRIFGDWISPPKPNSKNDNLAKKLSHPMHTFFRDVIFVDDSVSVSRLRLAQAPEARVELDFQLAGSWYQRLQLELDGTCTWPGDDGNYVVCRTYWKTRKLVVVIEDDKNFETNEDRGSENRMLVISVSESDASRLELWLKWKYRGECEYYIKEFKRVTAKEILMVDQQTKKSYI